MPSRPASRPSIPSPSQRPASGWELDRGNLNSHQPVNRTPSLSDRSRPSDLDLSNQRDAARDRAMTNPRLKPVFEGSPTERRDNARDRMNDAVRNAPSNAAARRASGAGAISASRLQNRAAWGTNVRRGLNPVHRDVFNRNWIDHRINRFPQRWFYWHRNQNVTWWWRWFTWSSLNQWIVYDWYEPFYYDYGFNPYYEDDVIFFDEEPVASYDDYVAGAQDLADAPDPPENAETEWESLSTWAISTNRDHTDSDMLLQLVLSEDGIVSGTYYHGGNDNTQRIHGSIDKTTQRLAFTIGNTATTVLETGLENLTQEEAPLWAHFLNERKTQTWLLIRLESPESESGQAP
jgi:hypothetical protein